MIQFEQAERQSMLNSVSSSEYKIVELLRNYIRNLDLNYIQSSKTYHKGNLTLTDLIKQDQISKKYRRINQIKIDLDSGALCSADLTANYLL